MRVLLGSAVPDQYHAFTTRLAAAGYQTTVMRMVAGCILGLGFPALLAGLAPKVTPWPGFRLAYVVIALACVALASPWLRYRWPTRRESAAVVVVGIVVLSAGCLATLDPLAGMVTASAFTFILGYVALFHSARLLAFAVLATAVTVGWLAARIAADDLPTALAVTSPIVLLCIVVTYASRTIATVGASEGAATEVDPVTGLLTRDFFYERASTLIGARQRTDDRYLVVAAVNVDNLNAIAGIHGNKGSIRARVDVGQALRETVRHDAVTGHIDETLFLIADTFTGTDPSPLIERVRGAIASTPSGVTASIGVVSTPLRPLADRPPHDALDEIIALATTAMYRARGRGGNQAEYLFDPKLSEAGDPAPEPGEM